MRNVDSILRAERDRSKTRLKSLLQAEKASWHENTESFHKTKNKKPYRQRQGLQTQIVTIEKVLRTAIGDLYGKGIVPEFFYSTGRIRWNVFSNVTNIPIESARKIAKVNCQPLLYELKAMVKSRQQCKIEKWIAERELGLPTTFPAIFIDD